VFNRVSTINLHTIQHFNPAETLGRIKAKTDREEIIGIATDTKFETSRAVVGVDKRVLPKKRASPSVVGILPVTFGNVRRTNPMWKGDADDDVLHLEFRVLEFILDVDVTAPGAVVTGPTVDGERNVGLVGAGESPFEDSHSSVEWEGFGWVFQSDDTSGLEKFFIDVWMSL